MDKKINSGSKLEFEITIRLTESEARALNAMVGFNVNDFLHGFYTKLGKSYLLPHEKGVRTLWETIKRELPPHLNKADRARKAFNGEIL